VTLPSDDVDIDASGYARACQQLAADGPVVVGHSMSGIALPLVPGLIPVRRLVYLAALVPAPGERMADVQAREQPLGDTRAVARDEHGRSYWTSIEAAINTLYQDCDPQKARETAGRLRPQARKPHDERCPLTDFPDLPTSYILMREDRMIRPDWSRTAARSRLGVEPIELPGGHSPMLAQPEQFAETLLALAFESKAKSLFGASPARPNSSKLGRMSVMEATEAPSGHTPEGGVLVGSEGARRRLVVFEDPQCPYCREFEDVSGDLLRREVAAGAVAVEFRIRSFLGAESVRAANALAVAAEAGRFDELRRELFANQPPEHSGGFTTADLWDLGRRAGLTSPDYVTAVEQGRYERWVREIDQVFEEQDPDGTPSAVLDGLPVDSETLYDADRLGTLIRS
jgi:hypothetical protein